MPYNPGISYRTDQYITRGFDSLNNSISRGADVLKERKDQAKKTKDEVDRYSKILEGLDYEPGEIAAMSLPEMQGEVEAGALKLVRDKQRAAMAGAEADRDMRREQFEYGKGQDAANRDFQREQFEYRQGQDAGALKLATEKHTEAMKGMKTQNEINALQLDAMKNPKPVAPTTVRTENGIKIIEQDGKFKGFSPDSSGGSENPMREQKLLAALREYENLGDTEAAGFIKGVMSKMTSDKPMTAMDILALKGLGYSDAEIRAMVGTGQAASAQPSPATPGSLVGQYIR